MSNNLNKKLIYRSYSFIIKKVLSPFRLREEIIANKLLQIITKRRNARISRKQSTLVKKIYKFRNDFQFDIFLAIFGNSRYCTYRFINRFTDRVSWSPIWKNIVYYIF